MPARPIRLATSGEGRETLRAWARLAAAQSELRPGHAALDLGCGSGVFAEALAEASGALVFGIDLQPVFRDPQAGAARFLLGDATALPVRSHSLRLTFLSHVAHHILEPPRAFREVARCLSPGGVCLVRTLSSDQLGRRAELRFLPPALAPALKGLPAPGDIASWMCAAGLQRIRALRVIHPSAWTLGELLERARAGALPSAALVSEADREAGLERLRGHVERLGVGAREEEEYTLVCGVALPLR